MIHERAMAGPAAATASGFPAVLRRRIGPADLGDPAARDRLARWAGAALTAALIGVGLLMPMF